MSSTIKKEDHTTQNANNTYEDESDNTPDLSLTSLREKVWLVKLPKFLFDHWFQDLDTDSASGSMGPANGKTRDTTRAAAGGNGGGKEPGSDLGMLRIDNSLLLPGCTAPKEFELTLPFSDPGVAHSSTDASFSYSSSIPLDSKDQLGFPSPGTNTNTNTNTSTSPNKSTRSTESGQASESRMEGGIPRSYKLGILNSNIQNSFVFTDRALANDALSTAGSGTGSRTHSNSNLSAMSTPTTTPPIHPHPSNTTGSSNVTLSGGGGGGGGGRVGKRYKPQPRKTSLIGTIVHEASVSPIDTPDYRLLLKSRTTASQTPRRTISRIEDSGHNLLHPSSSSNTSSFIPSRSQAAAAAAASNGGGGGGGGSGGGSGIGKAARIPRNELLDLLFKCFEEYEYWSLKAFRERIRQPESYLREVLESIAVLNKRGPYATKWSLKNEYKGSKLVSSMLAGAGAGSGAGTSSSTSSGGFGVKREDGRGGMGGLVKKEGSSEEDEDEDEDEDEEMEDII